MKEGKGRERETETERDRKRYREIDKKKEREGKSKTEREREIDRMRDRERERETAGGCTQALPDVLGHDDQYGGTSSPFVSSYFQEPPQPLSASFTCVKGYCSDLSLQNEPLLKH